jgi:hypothetical protein
MHWQGQHLCTSFLSVGQAIIIAQFLVKRLLMDRQGIVNLSHNSLILQPLLELVSRYAEITGYSNRELMKDMLYIRSDERGAKPANVAQRFG